MMLFCFKGEYYEKTDAHHPLKTLKLHRKNAQAR